MARCFDSPLSEAGLLTRPRVASGDDFIAKLWQVHRRVKEEGYVQASRVTARPGDAGLTVRNSIFPWVSFDPTTWSIKI